MASESYQKHPSGSLWNIERTMMTGKANPGDITSWATVDTAAPKPRFGFVGEGIEIREEVLSELPSYVLIRSYFETDVVLDVHEGIEGFELSERRLDQPYHKDYDSLENPLDWPRHFDVSNWMMMGAFRGDLRIGGVVGAYDSPGTDMLERRRDLLVVWDLRVSPNARRQGVGTGLLSAVETWARKRNCNHLKVETQNTNVAACRLYSRHGFRLTQARRNAYLSLPNDIQLIWCKAIND